MEVLFSLKQIIKCERLKCKNAKDTELVSKLIFTVVEKTNVSYNIRPLAL